MVPFDPIIMDAGKIRSLIPNVDVRADSGTDTHAGRRSDAGTVVQKVAPMLALDALLTSADADLKTEVAAVPPPRSGIVVDLSLPALTAQAALRAAHLAATAIDYSHLDPHKLAAERSRTDARPESGEGFGSPASGAAASGLQSLDRGASQGALPLTSPDVRPDLYPQGLPPAAAPKHWGDTAAQKAAISPMTQARDTERLAGLALAPESRFAGTPAQLSKLLIGAVIVGVLILVLL
jgi:hypothetical protein